MNILNKSKVKYLVLAMTPILLSCDNRGYFPAGSYDKKEEVVALGGGYSWRLVRFNISEEGYAKWANSLKIISRGVSIPPNQAKYLPVWWDIPAAYGEEDNLIEAIERFSFKYKTENGLYYECIYWNGRVYIWGWR